MSSGTEGRSPGILVESQARRRLFFLQGAPISFSQMTAISVFLGKDTMPTLEAESSETCSHSMVQDLGVKFECHCPNLHPRIRDLLTCTS